jgi:hypothetical protein
MIASLASREGSGEEQNGAESVGVGGKRRTAPISQGDRDATLHGVLFPSMPKI